MAAVKAVTLFSVLLAAFSVSYYFGFYLPHSQKAEHLEQKRRDDASHTIELAKRCRDDGMQFFEKYAREAADKDQSWDRPEFHFSTKLNTCLVYIRYIHFLHGAESLQYNVIFNVYANSPLILGWFKRDTSVEPWKEDLLTSMDSTPNYTSTRFFAEKDKIFNER